MKDIKIDTIFMEIQYFISWLGFIALGLVLAWIIAIGLYSYGKNTIENTKKQRFLLNMTYQKFIFTYGSIFGDLFIIVLLINLVIRIFV